MPSDQVVVYCKNCKKSTVKSKYYAALKESGGKRNEDIETLIKDLGKR
jgi:hypothetical protein